MLNIESSGLRVSLLDPEADRSRFGSRYCVGGYIWQVEDAEKGPLLSGPQFPNPNPLPWDGQGMPEAFEIALGQHRVKLGEEVCVIGVGKVKRESPVKPFHVRNNFNVTEFAQWKIDAATGPGSGSADGSGASLTMTCDQAFQEWGLQLVRKVSLRGRVLESATTVRNTGGAELPIRWFAHPFFPHAGMECFAFSGECSFPFWVSEGGGFRWNDRGYVERKADYDWTKGCYQLVSAPFGFHMDVTQRHPLLGDVKIECRFPLAWLPIWANETTISFEPYHHTVVPCGGSSEWAMRYHF